MLTVTDGTVVATGDLACIGDTCQTKKPVPFLTFDLGEGKMCAAGEGPQPTKPKPTKPKKTTKPKEPQDGTPPIGGTGDVCYASVRGY